jgi:2-keto-4-pentenoate hydratase
MAATEHVWDDPRVVRGMAEQLHWRADRLAAGERHVGWKIGLGAPAMLIAADISGPVVGFLTDRVMRENGYEHSCSGAVKPALEAEIAIFVGAALEANPDRATAGAAIAGLGAAIEIADVERPPTEIEPVVAGNVFNRAVILGPCDTTRARGDVSGLSVSVRCGGAEVAETSDVVASVGGDPVDLLRHVAGYLAAFGQALAPGDVVITGSQVPLQFPSPGTTYEYELVGVGRLAVGFT